MAATSSIPYGKRLVPAHIDDLARSGETRPFCRVAKTEDPADGFRDISYQQLAAAINSCAFLLDAQVQNTLEHEPVAFISNVANDLRHFIVQVAAAKTGRVSFLPSPRNSMAAHLALIDNIKCSYIAVPAAATPLIVKQIAAERPMKILPIPDVDELLGYTGPAYAFDKTWDELREKPALILHTSGSTGLPKPIVVTHLWFSSTDAFNLLPDSGPDRCDYLRFRGLEHYVAFPFFHAAGNLIALSCILWFGGVLIIGPPLPVTAELVDSMHRSIHIDLSVLPPSIIKDMTEDPAYLEQMGKVRNFMYAGGGVSPSAGNALSKVSRLFSGFGTTECAALPWMPTDDENWDYMRFRPETGADFRHVAGDEYQLFFVRKPEYELWQAIFSTFPELQEYDTKDIWTPHPTKKTYWKHKGRADDIIVYSNGEKLNPTTIENIVNSNPAVRSALVIGAGRFQSSMLIEPHDPTADPEELKKLMDSIWPDIKKANVDTVSHGRVAKDFVIFSNPEKPFLRASKGTVQKKATLQLYESEINDLYASNEAPAPPSTTVSIDLTDAKSVRQGLRTIITQQLGSDEFEDNTNLFNIGFDSLMASNLARGINLAVGRDVIKPNAVYKNYNITKLVGVLSSDHSSSGKALSREEKMQALYEELVTDLPISARPAAPIKDIAVLITGSTGSIGSYVLHSLLNTPGVSKIYCINRTDDAPERQLKSLDERGLDSSLVKDSGKVVFLTGDFAKPYFGVGPFNYIELLNNVTHIFHNAWQVNFNWSLDSFEPQVRGVRRAVDFSSHSVHGAHIFFTSTVATTGRYPSARVPEKVIYDWTQSSPMGYAEGKQIGEAILARAQEVGAAPTTICRVGQVAGPILHGTKGAWNRSEWFPTIIKTSTLLGLLPDNIGGGLDWIPVDVLADALVELLLNKPTSISSSPSAKNEIDVVHTVDPHETTWSELIPAVLSTSPRALEVVSMAKWVEALEKSSKADGEMSDPAHNPGLKLLDFYKVVAQGGTPPPMLETSETVKRSPTMAKLSAPTKEWMELWMRQWDLK